MYEKISARRTVPELYEAKLVVRPSSLLHSIDADSVFQKEDVLDPNKIASIRAAYKSELEAALSRVASHVPSASMLEKQWKGIVWPASPSADRNPATGVEHERLKSVGAASVKIPDGFVSFRMMQGLNYLSPCSQEIHPKLQRHVKNRLASIDSGKGLDWATAEVYFVRTHV